MLLGSDSTLAARGALHSGAAVPVFVSTSFQATGKERVTRKCVMPTVTLAAATKHCEVM